MYDKFLKFQEKLTKSNVQTTGNITPTISQKKKENIDEKIIKHTIKCSILPKYQDVRETKYRPQHYQYLRP